MKKIIFILLVLLSISTIVKAEDNKKWTTTDTLLQSVFLAELLIDRNQTNSQKEHNCKEENFILGEYPTKQKVDIYFVVCGVAHTIISNILDKPYRTYWQGFWIIFETDIIKSNHDNFRAGYSLHF